MFIIQKNIFFSAESGSPKNCCKLYLRAIPLLAELFQYKPLRVLFPWLTKMFLLIRVKGKFWRFNKINWLKKGNTLSYGLNSLVG